MRSVPQCKCNTPLYNAMGNQATISMSPSCGKTINSSICYLIGSKIKEIKKHASKILDKNKLPRIDCLSEIDEYTILQQLNKECWNKLALDECTLDSLDSEYNCRLTTNNFMDSIERANYSKYKQNKSYFWMETTWISEYVGTGVPRVGWPRPSP